MSPVSGVRAVVWGVIRVSSTGSLNIFEREDDTTSPIICFDSVTRCVAKVKGREVDKRKSPVVEFFKSFRVAALPFGGIFLAALFTGPLCLEQVLVATCRRRHIWRSRYCLERNFNERSTSFPLGR